MDVPRDAVTQDAMFGLAVVLGLRVSGSSWTGAVLMGVTAFAFATWGRRSRQKDAARRAAGLPLRPSVLERVVFGLPLIVRVGVILAVVCAVMGPAEGWVATGVITAVVLVVTAVATRTRDTRTR